MSSLGEAIIHLGIDLFHQIRQSKKENIFYSPLSISSALAMTYLGARENTASQMQKVGGSCLSVTGLHGLSAGCCADDHRSGCPRIPREAQAAPRLGGHREGHALSRRKSTDAYELSVANRLYGEKEFRFLQVTSVESADFKNAAEESRKMINSWVESQTNGRIKDLFPKDSLDSSTVLVLVNAVYFKGQWNQKFKEENTVEENKPVQMMKQTNSFNFMSLEDVQAKILEIPYKGSELSMMVLLPDERADKPTYLDLEDQLTAEKLIAWTSPQNMRKRQVDLYLPRFKVEESYDLVPTLQALGMVDAFRDGVADFSGMTGGRDLVVSKVFHKCFVEVTEEGTEAAAATGVEIIERAGRNSESFRCNHPFLFLIKHIKTNSILFCGRVSSP
uniref:Serpin domain-containing protein n=1 Tax=Bos taurus TaxID=9913 RepID=A0ABI0NNT8_BOVIN